MPASRCGACPRRPSDPRLVEAPLEVPPRLGRSGCALRPSRIVPTTLPNSPPRRVPLAAFARAGYASGSEPPPISPRRRLLCAASPSNDLLRRWRPIQKYGDAAATRLSRAWIAGASRSGFAAYVQGTRRSRLVDPPLAEISSKPTRPVLLPPPSSCDLPHPVGWMRKPGRQGAFDRQPTRSDRHSAACCPSCMCRSACRKLRLGVQLSVPASARILSSRRRGDLCGRWCHSSHLSRPDSARQNGRIFRPVDNRRGMNKKNKTNTLKYSCFSHGKQGGTVTSHFADLHCCQRPFIFGASLLNQDTRAPSCSVAGARMDFRPPLIGCSLYTRSLDTRSRSTIRSPTCPACGHAGDRLQPRSRAVETAIRPPAALPVPWPTP